MFAELQDVAVTNDWQFVNFSKGEYSSERNFLSTKKGRKRNDKFVTSVSSVSTIIVTEYNHFRYRKPSR